MTKNPDLQTNCARHFLDIPLDVRKERLNNMRTRDLKDALPTQIWEDIMRVYLDVGWDSDEAKNVFHYITKNCHIAPEVARRPSDADPFQVIYRDVKSDTALDEYYQRSNSATAIHLRRIALEDNLPGIIRREITRQKLQKNEKFIILDVGSGPGDAIRKALRKKHHADLLDRVVVHCVDPDERSINRGKALVEKDGLSENIKFFTMSMEEYSEKIGLAQAT